MKLRPIALALLAGFSCTLNSCIQSESENALNPDGSGKFTIKATLDMGPLMGLMQAGGKGAEGGEAPDPSKEMLLGVLASTQGVDVWKEAKTEKSTDGKIKISASGYFKDIAKFKAGNPMDSMGGGSGVKSKSSGPGLGEIKSSKDANGNWIIEIPMSSKDKPEEESAEPAPKMTKEEITQKVAEMRAQFGMMKPMMESMLGGMKITEVVSVGGTIKDYGLFTKVDDHSAKFEIEFKKIFAGMEKLMADDKTAELMAASGKSDPMKMLGDNSAAGKEIEGKIMEAMFGAKGEPKLVITPGKDLFDYAKESAAALAGQSPELKALLKKASEKGADSDDSGAGEKTIPMPKKKKAA